MTHQPVLLTETLDALLSAREAQCGVFVDGTFGRGGHARAILARLGADDRLLVIDRDPDALASARALADEDVRVTVFAGAWSEAFARIRDSGAVALKGVLLDVGVSSPQLDDGTRGFSFRIDGPLDMRMDPNHGRSASEWLNSAEERDIARVLRDFGEERFAKRIARAIVHSRPLSRTFQLRDVVDDAVPQAAKRSGKHSATRTFQAVRIHVNGELDELQSVLPEAFDLLAIGGRLAVISFHSLEDRCVKQFFRERSSLPPLPRRVPRTAEYAQADARLIGRSVTPGDRELAANPRARSARLRVLERLR